jgi:NADP-dependent 3-hydroxy acid dehydrogenase YdfG
MFARPPRMLGERKEERMLNGKTALITGSLGGIGFATAKALAGLGYDVMLNGFAPADTIDAISAPWRISFPSTGTKHWR